MFTATDPLLCHNRLSRAVHGCRGTPRTPKVFIFLLEIQSGPAKPSAGRHRKVSGPISGRRSAACRCPSVGAVLPRHSRDQLAMDDASNQFSTTEELPLSSASREKKDRSVRQTLRAICADRNTSRIAAARPLLRTAVSGPTTAFGPLGSDSASDPGP